jgi:hypothetical protein
MTERKGRRAKFCRKGECCARFGSSVPIFQMAGFATSKPARLTAAAIQRAARR